MSTAIQQVEKSIEGSISLLITDHSTGKVIIEYKKDELREASSTIKVFITQLVFEELKNGRWNLDTQLNILPEDRHFGSGILNWTEHQSLSVEQHLSLIAYYSESVSTNVFIRLFGGRDAVNARIRQLGYMHSVETTIPLVSSTTLNEAVRAFRSCYGDSRYSSLYQKISLTLHESWFDISSKAQDTYGSMYWHKTGSLTNYGPQNESVYNAVGIIKTDSGLYDFALYTRGFVKELSEDEYKQGLVKLVWDTLRI
jgi:Beta-lactamase enzyme family